ncbi:MAG: Ig-like domain-containing protein, partial [Gemmatimonadota bacterium]
MLLSAVFLTLGGAAHARNTYLSTFNATYGTSGTKLDDCITCHTSQGTSTWNPYGLALQSRIGSGIAAALAAVEPLDSDGDGYTNIVEINARKFPGDAADFPAPTDTTPPTVSSTSPANGATGVAVNAAVTATFSEPVKNVGPATFTLAPAAGGAGVNGTVTVSGATATFTPSANLAYATSYRATVTTGVMDLANNALAASYSWTFTTGAAPDTTAPAVTSTNPANGATGVAVNAAVTATFSEAVKNVSTTTFTLAPAAGGAGVNGTVTVSGATATFTPSANLAYATSYRATVTTGVMDLANNALAASYSWTFTTGAAADTTAPTVTSTSPASGATGVAANAAV